MKIALSGNVYALADMLETQEFLEKKKHEVTMAFEIVSQISQDDEFEKEENRRCFFEKIKGCDMILVVNKSAKDGKKNYISGSSFLEMGYAHALGKKIVLLQGIPDVSYRDEIIAMSPIVLHGDLEMVF